MRTSAAGETTDSSSGSQPLDAALEPTRNELDHPGGTDNAEPLEDLGYDNGMNGTACLEGAELGVSEGPLPEVTTGEHDTGNFGGSMRPGDSTGDRFDVVLGSDVVHEQSMADGVVSVLKRYLRSDGLAIIVNPHSHHRAGVERFHKLLKREGFIHKVTEIDGMGLEHSPLLDVEKVLSDCRTQVETGVMARLEEEMRDVRLQLHRITWATQERVEH